MVLHSALVTALLTSSLTLIAGATVMPTAEATVGRPVVNLVSPSSGPTKNPARVVITGKRLGATVKVRFGAKAGKRIRVLSDRKITVRPPWHAAGTVRVRVKTREGGWSKVVGRYTYVAAQTEGRITRLSEGQFDMENASMSDDGRYVGYVRYNEAIAQTEVFVLDRETGVRTVLTRVAYVAGLSISGDGRYLVYAGGQTTTSGEAIVVIDRATGTKTAPVPATVYGGSPAISTDGRFVTFSTSDSDLTPSDDNRHFDVHVWDTVSGTIDRVTDGNGDSTGMVSDDGRNMLIRSDADLIPGGATPFGGTFMFDRDTRTFAEFPSEAPPLGGARMSADGRSIAYLPADDGRQLIVWNRASNSSEQISIGSRVDFVPVISTDGRFLAITSDASNNAPGEVSEISDVFVWDRLAEEARRVTRGDANSYVSGVSADGEHVLIQSYASDLVPGDRNGEMDTFVWDAIVE